MDIFVKLNQWINIIFYNFSIGKVESWDSQFPKKYDDSVDSRFKCAGNLVEFVCEITEEEYGKNWILNIKLIYFYSDWSQLKIHLYNFILHLFKHKLNNFCFFYRVHWQYFWCKRRNFFDYFSLGDIVKCWTVTRKRRTCSIQSDSKQNHLQKQEQSH